MTVPIIILIVAILLLFSGYTRKFNTSKKFQENSKPGDQCIFYDNGIIHKGYIINRRHDVTKVFDTTNHKEYTVFTLNTFPHHDNRK